MHTQGGFWPYKIHILTKVIGNSLTLGQRPLYLWQIKSLDATIDRDGLQTTGVGRKRRKPMPSTEHSAISMIRGKGDNAVTRYSCGAVDKAKKNGVEVLVMRRDKRSGRMVRKLVKPRQVHREDPLAVYGETHELAGQGKYICIEAFPNGDRSRVVGAQHVNPYLRDDGAYATIVETLKSGIGKKTLAKLTSRITSNELSGTHLLWEGKRTADGFCPDACSEWMTREEVLKQALKINPGLLKTLRKSKSGRKGVKTHKSAQEKFFGDLDVLRRATCVVDVSTGDRDYRGGETPYAKPLEQCGFAIDRRFLTYGVDSDGNELGQYYYRLVIGRPEPHSLPRSSWVYEGAGSPVAFKDESTRRKFLLSERKLLSAA